MRKLFLATAMLVMGLGLAMATSVTAGEGDPPYPSMSRADVEQCGGEIRALFQRDGQEEITTSQDRIKSYEPGGKAYEQSHNESWWADAKRSDVANMRDNIAYMQNRLATEDPIAWFMEGISSCEDDLCLDTIDSTYGVGENFEHVKYFSEGLDYGGYPDTYEAIERPAVTCVAQVFMKKYRALHSGDSQLSNASGGAELGGLNLAGFGFHISPAPGDTGKPGQMTIGKAPLSSVKLNVIQKIGLDCVTMRLVATRPWNDAGIESEIEIKNGCAGAVKYKADLDEPTPGLTPSYGLGTIWIGDSAALRAYPANWYLPVKELGFTPLVNNHYDTLMPGGTAKATVVQQNGMINDIQAILASCDAADDKGHPLELFYLSNMQQFTNLACYPIPDVAPK